MERKIYTDLLEWKNSSDRKPLILQGARQVGKTYIVNLFGNREYANVVYCNFEREQGLKDLFADVEPKSILKKIGNLKRKEILPTHTLIIFDGIHACPEALDSLKYFCDEANEYHIIATGCLGAPVAKKQFSFPVGKVQVLEMYPMDFEEFLLANGHENLVNVIKDCYREDEPLNNNFHRQALDLYKKYLFIGGMPEVVEEYLKDGIYELVRIKQEMILDSYYADMNRSNKTTEFSKIKLVYQCVSPQLAKENKKFQYALIKRGGRASEFANAIEWLSLRGLASRLFRVEQLKMPLTAYSTDDFKLYMNDVGLCSAIQNVTIDDILYDNADLSGFKDGVNENYIFNQMTVNKKQCYYWAGTLQYELDFVTRMGNCIVPIKLKSQDSRSRKSLLTRMRKLNFHYAIWVSDHNFSFENNIKSVPYYAAFCIK